MANKKVSRRALFTSIMSLILCCAMLMGTTFAWFTDSVSTVNTIQSGNLDIELEYKLHGSEADWAPVTTATELFNKDALWEPGHAEVVYLRISNKGSLALKYQLGLNVVTENTSTNAAGENFALSNYIMFDVLDGATEFATRKAAIDAATNAKTIYSTYEHPYYDTYGQEGKNVMEKGASAQELTLVVYMPETVGNEANFKTGATVPTIQLGVNLTATQLVSESDSFGTDYDTEASLPQSGVGSAKAPTVGNVEVVVRNAASNAKLATVSVPADAVAENATNIDVEIKRTAADGNIQAKVGEGKDLQSFDVKVTGIKEENNVPITVVLRVGTGLSGVRVFHNGDEILEPAPYYNEIDGYVTFKTTSFSPFTVAYDAKYVEPDLDDTQPTADVTVLNVEEQNMYIIPDILNSLAGADIYMKPDTAYTFTANQTAEEVALSAYKDWRVDYYVSFDQEIAEGLILVGCYGNWANGAWYGFNVPAGNYTEPVALLGAMSSGGVSNWTYQDIVNGVETFCCGAYNSGEENYGKTMTVELRLINPENFEETIVVESIEYTFLAKD